MGVGSFEQFAEPRFEISRTFKRSWYRKPYFLGCFARPSLQLITLFLAQIDLRLYRLRRNNVSRLAERTNRARAIVTIIRKTGEGHRVYLRTVQQRRFPGYSEASRPLVRVRFQFLLANVTDSEVLSSALIKITYCQ